MILAMKFKALIEQIKQGNERYLDEEKRDAFIKVLEVVACDAETFRAKDYLYYDFLDKLHFEIHCALDQNKAQEAVQEIIKLAGEQLKLDEDTLSFNRWKAVGLLIVAALEFIVLGIVLGALMALTGAVILGVGFGAVAFFLPGSNPVTFQTVASIGALCGAIVGLIGGLITAGICTYSSLQTFKEWAGFHTYDSLWDLAIQGKGKQELVAEKILANCSFFNNGSNIEPIRGDTINQAEPQLI